MADGNGGSSRRHSRYNSEDDSILNSRSLEAFGRKVTATAGHIVGPFAEGAATHYQSALGDISRELRHPIRQRQLFALSQASPRELVRSKLSVNEIQHRALTYLPEELLDRVPENTSPYSLFQGFQASLPDDDRSRRRKLGKHGSKTWKLLGQAETAPAPGEPPALSNLRNEKQGLDHRLEMLNVRKNMCSTEIREIDTKISNLNSMRGIVLDRLADLEQEEIALERELIDVDGKLEVLEEEIEDEAAMSGQKTPTQESEGQTEQLSPDSPVMDGEFMSESIYEKLPMPKKNRPRPGRRKTTFILHEHLQSGSKIRELQAHHDTISALDFDVPFGTMVTAAFDDTVRVWDLNAGQCMGLLEGHLSSVRCLQVEDSIVATGSMDASVRLWDLSQADYTPPISNNISDKPLDSDSAESTNEVVITGEDTDTETHDLDTKRKPPPAPSASSMVDCGLFTLSAHVAEITALHFHNGTLISGSADKTLRQWDLEKGRCVQTLDVLWAAAQASSSINSTLSGGGPASAQSSAGASSSWRPTGPASRTAEAADFVGAVQCFDAALACGTADGMVRLWDLRSGQVHRSLVGHTAPVTCLQFDDVHLVTGSLDRSVRIWDLRTGSIVDAWGYDGGVTSMMFDARRVVAAAGEDVVKVYDKTDGRHWSCGAGPDADKIVPDGETAPRGPAAIVERVRIKDGYLVEGRRDGMVGVWSC